MDHGGVEYCWQCGEFPCARYEGEEYDSFITWQNRLADPEKARRVGVEAYQREQRENLKFCGFCWIITTTAGESAYLRWR